MRIGILVNGDTVHAFEAVFIEQIRTDHELVVLRFESADSDPSDHRLTNLLWRHWSKKHLYPKMHAMRPRSLFDLLGPHEPVSVRFERKGKYSFYATDSSLASLQKLDVILSCQYRIIRGSFLDHPAHGIWSFHHDDEMMDGRYLVDGKRRAFSLERIAWNILRREAALPKIPGVISNTIDLDPASWTQVCVSKGISEDGWCQKRFEFAFDLDCPMTLEVHFEYPGWQPQKYQHLRVTAGDQLIRLRLPHGMHILRITLAKGVQRISVTARSTFKMPSPDTRTCTLNLRKFRLSQE
jgi:hypothetical protein